MARRHNGESVIKSNSFSAELLCPAKSSHVRDSCGDHPCGKRADHWQQMQGDLFREGESGTCRANREWKRQKKCKEKERGLLMHIDLFTQEICKSNIYTLYRCCEKMWVAIIPFQSSTTPYQCLTFIASGWSPGLLQPLITMNHEVVIFDCGTVGCRRSPGCLMTL